jgi:nitrite reductase/ring-hydroxylating ferredoxin subunit/uncharacterized membrane protein
MTQILPRSGASGLAGRGQFASFGGARERVTNALHGTWLGHPVHPIVNTVPTGAVATAIALDGVSMLPGSSASLRDASRYALGVGIVGSVAAAVTGVADWQHTHEESRRIGLIHGALNGISTALYVTSWWDRRRGRQLPAMAKSALGYGISACAGYLGGELVYGSGLGVDRSGDRLTTTDWTPVLAVTDLADGESKRVEVHGVGVVLHRTGGEVLAVGEFCPHLGAPMCDGWIDRDMIVCPWHGSRFSPCTGEVLRGPATASLHCYSTRDSRGMIEVRGDAPASAASAKGVER